MIEIKKALTQLELSGLIRVVEGEPEFEYQFRHALVQEATYESLLKTDRRLLHGRIGEVLERLYPDKLDEFSGLLAHHYTAAGNQEKALDYLTRAGMRTFRTFALGEAIEYLSQARQIASHRGELEQLRHILQILGEAYSWRDKNEQALECLKEALPLCQEAHEKASLYDAIGYIYHRHLTDVEQGLAYYQEAIASLGEADHSIQMAKTCINLGYYYGILPGKNPSLAQIHLHRAAEILQNTEEFHELAICYSYLGSISMLESPHQAITWGQRALDIYRRHGLFDITDLLDLAASEEPGAPLSNIPPSTDPGFVSSVFNAGAIYTDLALSYMRIRKGAEALQAARASLQIWEKLGHVRATTWALPLMSVAYNLINQPDEGDACQVKALALPEFRGWVYYNLACFNAVSGRGVEALQALKQGWNEMDERSRKALLLDRDLNSLRGDPEFQAMVAKVMNEMP